MHEEPAELIRRELYDAETLLWSGRPRQGFLLRPMDGYLIPFSILWGGFAIFWEVMVLSGKGPPAFGLFGIPFVLIGLYMMFGRFFVDIRQRAATTYGVTSERIVIISGLFSRQVKSLSIDTLSDVSLSQRSRHGTITFGAVPPMAYWYASGPLPGSNQQLVPSFELGEDARDVYQIILDLRRSGRRQAAAQ